MRSRYRIGDRVEFKSEFPYRTDCGTVVAVHGGSVTIRWREDAAPNRLPEVPTCNARLQPVLRSPAEIVEFYQRVAEVGA